jgi:ATP-dependent Lon protease
MTCIPVILNDGTDILRINGSVRRGNGCITLTGPVSLEIENELEKALSHAQCIADLGEFRFPDLSNVDIHLTFSCQSSELPVSGASYGLGLGIEILRLLSGRRWTDNQCYTGCVDERGDVVPVEGFKRKLHCAAAAGFSRIFVPHDQLDYFSPEIAQVPVESLFEAWSVLSYGLRSNEA